VIDGRERMRIGFVGRIADRKPWMHQAVCVPKASVFHLRLRRRGVVETPWNFIPQKDAQTLPGRSCEVISDPADHVSAPGQEN